MKIKIVNNQHIINLNQLKTFFIFFSFNRKIISIENYNLCVLFFAFFLFFVVLAVESADVNPTFL
jgi:hypothetical protein